MSTRDLFAKTLLVTAFAVGIEPAFACDPNKDYDCCAQDSDCAMYVNTQYCAAMPANKIFAEKYEKENLPTATCTAATVAKLHENKKVMKPKCISRGCDFEIPGE
jgi:hypothetical protein